MLRHSALLASLLVACSPVPDGLDDGPPDLPDFPELGDDDDSAPGADDDDSTPDPGDDDDDSTPDPGDDCPDGVTCLDSFPAYVSGDTALSSTSDFDSYACAPGTDESGPEDLFRIDVPAEGLVALSIEGVDEGVDVDVHLLGSLDPSDCIDRGHWAAGGLLPAGSWFVVVDSWVNGAGESQEGGYDLTLNHVTPEAYEPDGVDGGLMELALVAFDNAWFDGETDRFDLTFIDFSISSTLPRLWTFDLLNGTLLYNLHVSHGEASGMSGQPDMADSFSNIEGSHQSSLGLMRTAETYGGGNGYSLRLDGLEPDYNGLVRPRAIVVHGATYARPEFAAEYGYLGRSWGCPAVDDRIATDFIDDIAYGSLMLSYYPDGDWELNSDFLEGL